ncbi:hypothetical protein RHMOL_Rhmol09G0201100 [Rhododendron molle]|uniref:Uncharacterized protein n=1 Tax=Rhododendron molle TaxID=49168 RepID=A0ACC0MFP8_RHOML|nr:hypothetical protein RHMOL_Rhmol09G0201100 [Rhododendron molle]
MISLNSCTLVFLQAFDRESSDRDMVGRPVLALEIGTLFADFAEFLVLVPVFKGDGRSVLGSLYSSHARIKEEMLEESDIATTGIKVGTNEEELVFWIFRDVPSDITIVVTGGTFALHEVRLFFSRCDNVDLEPLVCRVRGNPHVLIRMYGLMCCRQCFRSNTKELVSWSTDPSLNLTMRGRKQFNVLLVRWQQFLPSGTYFYFTKDMLDHASTCMLCIEGEAGVGIRMLGKERTNLSASHFRISELCTI